MNAYTVDRHETRERWLAARRNSIGGSDAGALLGLNPYASAYALFLERRGLAPAKEQNEAMEWGNRLEAPIAEKYADETKRELIDHGRFTIFRSIEHPYMAVTLDREIVAFDERGPGALEIKSVGFMKAEEWAEAAPLPYQAQLQFQLAVTGWKWGVIAALIGGQQFRYAEYARDEKVCADLISISAEFWRMIEMNTPPAVDESQATHNALKAAYPTAEDLTIDLPGEAAEWDQELAQAKEEIKAGEAHKRGVENKIIAALGVASIGRLPNGGAFRYANVTRKGYVVDEKTYRELRRIK